MTLDLARIGPQTALPAAAPARGDASAAVSAHAETITLSAEARRASRELGPVPRGTVRWYRAACLPRPPRSLRCAAPAPATHAGVAAYRRAMASAAA